MLFIKIIAYLNEVETLKSMESKEVITFWEDKYELDNL